MRKRLLIVDDEKAVRDMLTAAFGEHGCEVVSAACGEEALEILARAEIYVIFIDLRLPGMDGLALCRTIRSQYPCATVYAMTGYSSSYELVDCRKAGFDDYFVKPVNLPLFYQVADRAFERCQRWLPEPTSRCG